jgi:hypothetical protein
MTPTKFNEATGHWDVVEKEPAQRRRRRPADEETHDIVSPVPGTPTPCTLTEVDAVFLRWFGEKYDLEVMHAALATEATAQLEGDPVWMLIVGAPGSAKTETLQALSSHAEVVSTITSEGALLSGSSKKETSKEATGGLLRVLGSNGTVVIKDFTSILSMHREARASVLAALREVYDGRWTRNLGVDGGKTLSWEGRLTVLAGVTTAWDEHHAVVASMGDRFVLFRNDSNTGRREAGRQAMQNAGLENRMRRELATAAAGVLQQVKDERHELTVEEEDRLLAAADLVTRARTAVIRDFRGDVVDAHAPEAPTRFLKQLVQLMRGCLSLGMSREDALHLALRGARDSVPPLRLDILEDLGTNPWASVREIRQRLNRPRNTVDRELQGLHMLQLLDVDESDVMHVAGREAVVWRYAVASGLDHESLRLPVPGVSDHVEFESNKGGSSDFSGTPSGSGAPQGRRWEERIEDDRGDREEDSSSITCPQCSLPLPTVRRPRECFACGWAA